MSDCCTVSLGLWDGKWCVSNELLTTAGQGSGQSRGRDRAGLGGLEGWWCEGRRAWRGGTEGGGTVRTHAGLARPRLCCMTRILFAMKIKSSFEFPVTVTLTAMANNFMWCAGRV